MDNHCFAFAVLALACCCFAPSYSILPHPGKCPTNINFIMRPKPCVHEGDCMLTEKCCQYYDDTACLPAVLPNPACPNMDGAIGTCVEACSSDSDCGENKICCSNGCGHVCMSALPVKEGRCGPKSYTFVCKTFCKSDFDCEGIKKCCPNYCGTFCKNPI